MDDLISRQQAIDAICEHGTDLERRGITVLAVANHKQATVDLLENLPSAQPKQRWIPVTERLPEEGEVVLTQAKFKDDVKMAVSSRIDYNYWTGWGTRDINIIAWMLLPEPWKGEEDETD